MTLSPLSTFTGKTALFELPGRGRIKAFGEDRKRLLHAMTTNHVQGLTQGQGCYAFLLNAQGRILSDLRILDREDYLLLDTEPARREFVLQHLDRYIIADDVTLEDVSDRQTTIALEGPGAAQVLEAIDAPVPVQDLESVEWAGRLIVRTSFTGADGFHIYVNPLDAPVLKETLLDAGAVEVGPEAVESARIAHGKPLYGVDIVETTLPQETQIADALHFQKGCYLGQEIVERIRSRGHVNKLLTKLTLEAAAPPLPKTKVTSAGKEVGEITSSAYDAASGKVVALGYIRAEALKGGAELAVDGAPARAPV